MRVGDDLCGAMTVVDCHMKVKRSICNANLENTPHPASATENVVAKFCPNQPPRNAGAKCKVGRLPSFPASLDALSPFVLIG